MIVSLVYKRGEKSKLAYLFSNVLCWNRFSEVSIEIIFLRTDFRKITSLPSCLTGYGGGLRRVFFLHSRAYEEYRSHSGYGGRPSYFSDRDA